MTQYFNIRVKLNMTDGDPLTAEAIHERLSYEIVSPVTIVSVEEDVQARGMGDSLEQGEA